MKTGHIIKADLTRFIHSSDSRTVNTQIIRTVPFARANTLDMIRLPATAVIPVGKVGECSIKYQVTLKNYKIERVDLNRI